MYWTMEKIDVLTEEELSEIERRTERLMSIWKIQNLRGNAAIFHDDQHIGEQRRELNALKHPSVDVEGLMAFRQKAVVDSLTGNMLVHPLTTPVIEVDENNRRARSVWWSMGVEGLSKHRRSLWPLCLWEWFPAWRLWKTVHGKSSGEFGSGRPRMNIMQAG